MVSGYTARPEDALFRGSLPSLPEAGSKDSIARGPPGGIVGQRSGFDPLRSMNVFPLFRQTGLFFEPVQLHLELSNLLVQFGLQCLIGFVPSQPMIGE